jgi:nitrogen-specific signal transduction histidine kinase/ActR/RegA family two-component response regulator/HAMP domain-containing protein
MMRKFAKKFSSVRMQLVASVFVAIAPALVLTYILNQDWFWQYSPDWLKQYAAGVPWASFLVGLLALMAAWYGGEHFILRQVRALADAAQRLTKGDWNARTGLKKTEGELGHLARTFDAMAESLQQRGMERENAEKILLNRAMQQSVVAGLGQFAMTNSDLPVLLSQAAMLVAQTLEVQYSAIYERLPDGELILQAGVGWKHDCVGFATVPGGKDSQIGFTLHSGEPVVIADHLAHEIQFNKPALLDEHGVVSSVTILIATRDQPFGVIGAHTTQRREFTSDEVQFLMAVANSIGMAAERKRAEAILQKLAAFARLNPNAALELTRDGKITYFNEAAQNLTLIAGKQNANEILPGDVNEIIRECLDHSRSRLRLETKITGRTFSWSFHPVATSQMVHCYVEDITERLSLEEQLRQSQKMESVGQLAAGVAHDFNNMLTIIQGHSSSLLAKPTLPTEMLDSVQAVYFAAERAAALTRQLLMFSRKNVMQLKPLDLRKIVGNMSTMLQRLLGETIKLQFQPPAELPFVLGDSGMIEQVVMNLAVNARDAMIRGGKLSIGVETMWIDAGYTGTHPEARVGNFIRLHVTDNGCGMDTATMSRIFEPFFTTKDVGKGTGLGLATVYGIVKQHFGWIEVNSEPGVGTMFDVFLPATDKLAGSEDEPTTAMTPVIGGTETILIVEDEHVLREMARDILGNCGYKILEASSGRDALEVWQRRTDRVDLLLTDMVMPEGVSGVELAERLLVSQPRLKIIFTSGYTANEVSPDVLSRTNAHFLQKPYTHNELAKAVRNCLDKNVGANATATA